MSSLPERSCKKVLFKNFFNVAFASLPESHLSFRFLILAILYAYHLFSEFCLVIINDWLHFDLKLLKLFIKETSN